MAKNKKGLAAFVGKKNTEKAVAVRAKDNPPPLTDFAEFIAPGFVGYAGTRFTSRVIHQMVLKRFPKLAKHASVLSTFGAATLAWFLVHRVKRVQKYHTPVVVGAGIAALQTAVQAYIPKYGWLVSDHNLNELPPQAQIVGAQPEAQTAKAEATASLPAPLFGWSPPARAKQGAAAPPPSSDDLVEIEDLDLGSLGGADMDGDGLSDEDIDALLN